MKFVWHFFFSVVTGLKTGGVLGTLYRYLLHGCGLDELFFRLWCNNRFFFFFLEVFGAFSGAVFFLRSEKKRPFGLGRNETAE